MTDPVTTPLRAESRKTTKSAISSTCPSLPMGEASAAFSSQSSPAPMEAALGGVLALGLGPPDVHAVDPDAIPAVGERRVASGPDQARFEATYGARYGWPPWAAMVMMSTIEPPSRRETMPLIAACMRKNGPRRL